MMLAKRVKAGVVHLVHQVKLRIQASHTHLEFTELSF